MFPLLFGSYLKNQTARKQEQVTGNYIRKKRYYDIKIK